MRFSVPIFCSSVLTLTNVKLLKTLALKNTFILETQIFFKSWKFLCPEVQNSSTIAFYTAVNHNYDDNQRTLKYRQSGEQILVDVEDGTEPALFIPLVAKQHDVFHRTEKDGDWYIYPQFVVHENPQNAHKNAQKSSKTFKPSIHNVVSTGTNFAKIWLTDVPTGCVRFARYCGKVYTRHLFPYGGLLSEYSFLIG